MRTIIFQIKVLPVDKINVLFCFHFIRLSYQDTEAQFWIWTVNFNFLYVIILLGSLFVVCWQSFVFRYQAVISLEKFSILVMNWEAQFSNPDNFKHSQIFQLVKYQIWVEVVGSFSHIWFYAANIPNTKEKMEN